MLRIEQTVRGVCSKRILSAKNCELRNAACVGKKPSVFVQSPSTLPTLTAVAEAIASMNVVLRDTATPPAGSAAASATPAQALAALYAAALSSQRDLPTQITGLVSGEVTAEAFQAATSVESLAATAAATVLPPHPSPQNSRQNGTEQPCSQWRAAVSRPHMFHFRSISSHPFYLGR